MISQCAPHDLNQILQDIIFIEKTKLKSTFPFSHLGALFRHFWLILGVSLGYLGPSWRQSGHPEASFGAILALWGILASLGAHLRALAPTLALLKCLLATSEASFDIL